MLLMLIGSVLGSQYEISSDLFLNRLNMSFGINYKYNGLLHHSIDRVWIVTMVALPKLEDIYFPDIAFDLDCAFVKGIKQSRAAALQVENIRSICKSIKPIINLMKGKESYYENAIRKFDRKKYCGPCMVQDTLMLVKAFRILPLLVRGFHMILTERHLLTRRKLCQL